MKRSFLTMALFLLPFGLTAAQGAEPEQFHWEETGWGGTGGFTAVAWHPTNPNIIYMGGDCNGMQKTEDKALHWRLINLGISSYGMHSVAISKTNPDTLICLGGDGACKSTDAGEHWQPLAETAPDKLNIIGTRPWTVRAVAIDPTNPQICYAGSSATGKLYKSEDGGMSWKQLDIEHATLAEMPLAKPVVEAPKKPTPAKAGPVTHDGIVEFGTWDQNKDLMGWAADNSTPFVTTVQVNNKIASKPKGGSLALNCEWYAAMSPSTGSAKLLLPGRPRDWSKAQKLTCKFYLPPDASPMQAEIGFTSVASGRYVYHAGDKVTGKPGEWVDVTHVLSEGQELTDVRMLSIVIDAPKTAYNGPVYVDDVFLYGEDRATVASTTQSGKASIRGMVGGEANVHKMAISSVAIVQQNPKLLLVSSSARGILRSEDGGASWTQVRAEPGAWSVTIAPSNPNIAYACYNTDMRMLKSTDAGKSWNYINQGVDMAFTPREIAVSYSNPDAIHVVGMIGWTGLLGNSTDGGKTWGPFIKTVIRDLSADPTYPDRLTEGSKDLGGMNRGNNICINPNNDNEIYVATGWRPSISLDGGKTWYERDRGASLACTDDVRFQPGGKVYVACEDMGLLMNPDNGVTWQHIFPRAKMNMSPDESDGACWRVWPTNNGQRILATQEPTGQMHPNHVILSEDAGQTWTLIRKHLPGQQPEFGTMWGRGAIRGLAADPKDPNIIYISLDGDSGGGIYKSTDAGNTWTALPHQPPSRRSWMGLHLDPTDSKRIYYGTTGEGGGLYRSDDGGDTWKHVFKQEPWILDFGVSASGIVYCGCQNLYRSTDHGETWEKLTDFKEEDRRVSSVEFDPENEKRFWFVSFEPHGVIGDIWRTTDGGKTFTDITGDNQFRKPFVIRYNPETHELWSAGVGLRKIKQ